MSGGSMVRRLALALRRLMLRTQRTPLRLAWRLAYLGVARGVVAYLRRGHPESSAYLSGSLASGDPLYGVSDIDIAVVLPDGVASSAARDAVVGRWERLRRAMPTMGELLVHVADFDQREVEMVAAAPVLTQGLKGPEDGGGVYAGRYGLHAISLAQRPGPYGPFAGWRLLSGRARLPAEAGWDRQALRIAAWLELQAWWSYVFAICVDPRGPRAPYLCLKMVSEPLRILVFLATGERWFERMPGLRRAAEVFPEHGEAIDWALALGGRLHRSPDPPLAEAVAYLIDLSAAIARRLGSELAGASDREVRLVWGSADELALEGGARQAVQPLLGTSSTLMPLVDWRALVRPGTPDEAFALARADPRDPAVLAAAAVASRRGPRLAMRTEDLLIVPDEQFRRARLRAVQCALTDPVSLALATGQRTARFPEAAGWSAGDWARRSVDEHRAWLAPDASHSPGATLGLLLSAARAALLLESLDCDAPELALTAATVSRRLAERDTGSADAAEEALHAYGRWRGGGPEPRPELVAGLRAPVLRLGYSLRRRN
jgi:predicted nucleotidyltransferase